MLIKSGTKVAQKCHKTIDCAILCHFVPFCATKRAFVPHFEYTVMVAFNRASAEEQQKELVVCTPVDKIEQWSSEGDQYKKAWVCAPQL